jgi:hypothetical protein
MTIKGDRLLYWFVFGSSSGMEGCLEAEFIGDSLDPGLSAEGASAGDALAEGPELFLGDRLVDMVQPSFESRPERWFPPEGRVGRFGKPVRAGPSPVRRVGDLSAGQRIAFDVSEGSQHGIAPFHDAAKSLFGRHTRRLDGEALVSALPDVPARTVSSVVATNVRRHQPLHPRRQVTVLRRPNDEMKMIRHEAGPENPHRMTLARPADQIHKGCIVVAVMKHLRPPVAPVDNMANHSTHRPSSNSRHTHNIPPPQPTVNPLK